MNTPATSADALPLTKEALESPTIWQKEDGWVIIKNKHFCDEFCQKTYEAHKEKVLP